MKNCPFCRIKKEGVFIIKNNGAFAVADIYPVTEGHTLVISKKHEENFFKLPEKDKKEVLNLVDRVRKNMLSRDSKIKGFNIGVNIGRSAGQTVMHSHIHIIPRRPGDCKNPAGGVRGVISGKRDY